MAAPARPSAPFPPRPAVDEVAIGSAASRLKALLFEDGPGIYEFAGYRVEESLGAGGMGEVFRAHDPRLGRDVALKVLRADDGRGATRLLAEARALAQLRHPNVVPVFEAGVEGDRVYIAMELIEGRTLDDWVRETSPDWRAAVAAYAQAGRGLAAAHRAGLIHRDFKPGNALIDDDGHVRVLDFGLAHAVAADTATDHSGGAPDRRAFVTSHAGTPAYMAPEQFNGLALTPACDQFSLCVALVEALYGELPSTVSDRNEVLRFPRKWGRRAGPHIPRWLERALRRGLDPTPGGRHPSMDSLVQELSRERRQSRRTAAVLGLGAAAFATAWFVSSKDPTEACLEARRPAREELTALRARVSDKLRAVPAEDALDDWQHAQALLDARRSRWDDALRGRCAELATTDGIAAARALRCLVQRSSELGALLRAIGDQPSDTRRGVARAVSRLPPVATCSTATATRSPAAGEERAPALVEFDRLHAELTARVALSHLDAADVLSAQLLETAQQTGDAAVLATAMLARGRALGEAGRVDEATTALRSAVATAEAIGEVRVAIDAEHEIVRLDLDAGRAAACDRLAEVAPRIDALVDEGRFGATQALLEGRCAAWHGQPATAQSHFERALVALEALHDRDTRPARAEIEHRLGRVLFDDEQELAGLAAFRRALSLEDEVFGRAACIGECVTLASLVATNPLDQTWFELAARHSGRCIDVPGADPTRGKELDQWRCLGYDNELWGLLPRADGTFWIRNKHTHACVAVADAAPTDFARIVQLECADAPHHRWQLVPDGDLLQIRSVSSGRCIDVAARGLDDGAPLIQFECNDGYNQRFELRVVGAGAANGRP